MKIRTIGIDLAKEVFGLHAVDVHGKVLLHTLVPRKRLLSRLTRLEPCLVGMEACGSAHYWAHEIERLGHKVRLMSPSTVRYSISEGQQERPERCRSDLRSGYQAVDAFCAHQA
jgi:transposase